MRLIWSLCLLLISVLFIEAGTVARIPAPFASGLHSDAVGVRTFDYNARDNRSSIYDNAAKGMFAYDAASILSETRVQNGNGNCDVLLKLPEFLAAKTAGPGSFMRVSESMSARATAYQGRITGLPSGTGYVANGVKFDGFANGVLLDAKGPGYANFVKNGQFESWWNGAESFVQQAQRQVGAAGGTPIQWHFADEAAANATKTLFQQRGIGGIEIIFTP